MNTNKNLSDNCIEIDGVIYTPEMRAKLKEWYQNEREVVPCQFVECLSEMQDYFSRIIADSSSNDDISKEKDLMSNAIWIKDDLKVFYPNNKIQRH